MSKEEEILYNKGKIKDSMIEIISIHCPKRERRRRRKERVKKVKKFLADHYDKHKSYVVNIPKKVSPVVAQLRKKKKAAAASHQPTPKKRTVSNKIWNVLQFVGTTGLIFMVSFLALNWEAYSGIFELKMRRLLEGEHFSALEELLVDKDVPQKMLPIAKDATTSKTNVPPLNLDIAPPDTRVIIPRINKNVPVVSVSTQNLIRRNWDALEQDIQEALRGGVVHYPGTAWPGDPGNVVITGHSSYFAWDPGRFKDVFALLHDVRIGDKIVVFHNQDKHVYQIKNRKVILPEQVSILGQGGADRLTLITCTPIGTNLKRLIIEAEPV